MKYRRLGRTGLMVSEIGFGAWGIGKSQWVGADDAQSLLALRRAVELGVNFIDTALAYGPGHSERLVGELVREMKVPLYVATKVPPKNLEWPARRGVPASEVFPAAHIKRSAEESLKNLGLDHIDLLQLHVWRDEFLADTYAGWQPALGELQTSGKVRFVGISVNDHDPSSALGAVASGLFHTAQIIYNIFDQTPEEMFFPACQKHDVGVIARVPFDEGGLTGTITPDTTFPSGDFPEPVLQRRPQAAGLGARRSPQEAAGRRGGDAAGAGPAVLPEPRGRLHGDPRHAAVEQRRRQRRRLGRAAALAGDAGEAERPRVAAQFLRLSIP